MSHYERKAVLTCVADSDDEAERIFQELDGHTVTIEYPGARTTPTGLVPRRPDGTRRPSWIDVGVSVDDGVPEEVEPC
jgi:hypothetical protein